MEIKILQKVGFEKVATAFDASTGLRAIIAVHNTSRGPGLGGIRMFPYPSEAAAIEDVLRLARAMTYKSASVDLKLGGGKAVIIGNPTADKSPALFHKMGEFINFFDGKYYSAKDAGITIADLLEVAKTSKYVTGLPGGSGDPSYLTACGIVAGMKVAAEFRFGKPHLKNLRIAVQGLGHVGYAVAKLLHFEGADLVVADIHSDLVKKVVAEFAAKETKPDQIHAADVEIFSPCALGGILNSITIPQIKAKIVAGAANNQLHNEEVDGTALLNRHILYAPDYMINAGGVINIYVIDILKEKQPVKWLVKIEDNLREVFEMSAADKISTARAADLLTEAKLHLS